MRKEAKNVKIGDKIKIAGKICEVKAIEISDIGKQGKRKVRLEIKTSEGEKVVVIRPEDYGFEEG